MKINNDFISRMMWPATRDPTPDKRMKMRMMRDVACNTGNFLQVAPRIHARPFWPHAGGKNHKPWEKQGIAHIRLQSIRSPLPPQLSSSVFLRPKGYLQRKRERALANLAYLIRS